MRKDEPKKSGKFGLLLLGLVAVTVGVMAREPIKEFFFPRPVTPPPTIVLPPVPPSPIKVAKPHLDKAEEESKRIITEHAALVQKFFVERKKGTSPFAEDALGYASKWRLVADYIPYTSGNRHENYIKERFENRIFKPADLEQVVNQVVKSYMDHLQSLENRMLVDLRADLAEFPASYPLAAMDEDKIRSLFGEAIQKARSDSGQNLQNDLKLEVVSIVAGEVLAQVALRLGAKLTTSAASSVATETVAAGGVSAGILSTGAASGWATLGVGLIAGIIVDQIVSWVWDWWADPKGNLASQINKKLDEMEQFIIDGSDKGDGLKKRLERFAFERATLRKNAVLSMLKAGSVK
ncbi:MAG: hypothetical protein ACKO23_07800 [Gemmataceae bacterium]